MFGLLNDPATNDVNSFTTMLDQSEYSFCRGRFYLFWNCIKTSGKPVLIALMAGSAAYQAEEESNDSLVKEVTGRLAKVFAPKKIPHPSEVIITHWKKDPFAVGSYSYVGPKTQPGDYDVMARPCGSIHFAGEATCGTHPATVHGAYISGLRAAADVTEAIFGPIHIESSPLVPPKIKQEATPTKPGPKRKSNYIDVWEPIDKPDPFTASLVQERESKEYELQMNEAIVAAIGQRPNKPGKGRLNPFIMYTKDHWAECKARCDAQKAKATGNTSAKASRQEIRTALGAEWRNASDAVKQPYLEKCKDGRETTTEALAAWEAAVKTWDAEAVAMREEYMAENKPPACYNVGRKARRMSD
jgi:Flavin containing amine oxidoreductase/HMG-box domain